MLNASAVSDATLLNHWFNVRTIGVVDVCEVEASRRDELSGIVDRGGILGDRALEVGDGRQLCLRDARRIVRAGDRDDDVVRRGAAIVIVGGNRVGERQRLPHSEVIEGIGLRIKVPREVLSRIRSSERRIGEREQVSQRGIV